MISFERVQTRNDLLLHYAGHAKAELLKNTYLTPRTPKGVKVRDCFMAPTLKEYFTLRRIGLLLLESAIQLKNMAPSQLRSTVLYRLLSSLLSPHLC